MRNIINKKLMIKMIIIIVTISFLSSPLQIWSKKKESIGSVRLNIETYLAGENQVTHPSVIRFDKPWNGYKYWMVYTPYPYGNGEEENPSISASNDLFYWETPKGMVNPIANNEELGCDELKDGHLVYRDDLDRIEVWYLGRISINLGGDGKSLTLLRKYSYDGINWSDYEIMDYVKYLSPSVRWDGNKYQMWSIGYDLYNTTDTIVYQESKEGDNWTEPEKCSIGDQRDGIKIWHGSVIFDEKENQYVLVYIKTGNDSQTIEVCESLDGIDFSKNKTIVENNKKTLWNRLYRPCLLRNDDGIYYLYYGVITDENKWYISLSYGENLNQLKGITKREITRMLPLPEELTNTKSIKYILKSLYHMTNSFFRIESLTLVVVCILLNYFTKRKDRKLVYVIEMLICIILCFIYTGYKFYTNTSTIIPILIISTIEGISCWSIGFFLQKITSKK